MSSTQPEDPDKKTNQPANRVFGIVLPNEELLYETLKSNPSKSFRAYRRLPIALKELPIRLVEFLMRRKRQPGDVRGLTKEQMLQREPYVGPMR